MFKVYILHRSGIMQKNHGFVSLMIGIVKLVISLLIFLQIRVVFSVLFI